MREQNELIAKMGETLRGLHVDRDDQTKDAQYWQDFAVGMAREDARRVGMEKQFDEALSAGNLRDMGPRITLAKVMREGDIARRVYFVAGLLIGCVLTALVRG